MADATARGGVATRAAKRRASDATTGSSSKTPLKSPLLSDYWQAQPPRKQARTQAPPTLRQLRKRGGSSEPVALSGYLGLLPCEVSATACPDGPPPRSPRHPRAMFAAREPLEWLRPAGR